MHAKTFALSYVGGDGPLLTRESNWLHEIYQSRLNILFGIMAYPHHPADYGNGPPLKEAAAAAAG